MDLVEEVYKITKLLPKDEKFALVDQLKRSSTSVVPLKSLYETVAGLKIAERLFKIDIKNVLGKCEIVGKELNALINSLTNDKRPKTKS